MSANLSEDPTDPESEFFLTNPEYSKPINSQPLPSPTFMPLPMPIDKLKASRRMEELQTIEDGLFLTYNISLRIVEDINIAYRRYFELQDADPQYENGIISRIRIIISDIRELITACKKFPNDTLDESSLDKLEKLIQKDDNTEITLERLLEELIFISRERLLREQNLIISQEKLIQALNFLHDNRLRFYSITLYLRSKRCAYSREAYALAKTNNLDIDYWMYWPWFSTEDDASIELQSRSEPYHQNSSGKMIWSSCVDKEIVTRPEELPIHTATDAVKSQAKKSKAKRTGEVSRVSWQTKPPIGGRVTIKRNYIRHNKRKTKYYKKKTKHYTKKRNIRY